MFAALLVGLVVQAASVAAQAPTEEPSVWLNLDRVRKALDAPPPITAPPPQDTRPGLVFRRTVVGRKPEEPPWKDTSGIPAYIRPPFPIAHHEFLADVTPEEFRGATTFPVGIPVFTLVGLVVKGIKIEHRKAQEAHAREEVREALDALLACRADPKKPGC